MPKPPTNKIGNRSGKPGCDWELLTAVSRFLPHSGIKLDSTPFGTQRRRRMSHPPQRHEVNEIPARGHPDLNGVSGLSSGP